MRAIAIFVVSLVACVTAPAGATEPRIALVIGNNAYDSGLRPLKNAVSDAELIAGALGRAGFEVEQLPNADRATMRTAIKNFRKRLEAAGPGAVGLFYFAGHGLQAYNVNYLLATDAEVAKPADIPQYGFEAEEVLWAMLKGGADTNILILDACRPNDVAKVLLPVARKGLSELDASGVDDRSVQIFYSTALGENAADGEDENGPFATALAENMLIPNLSLGDLFIKVRVQMKGSGQVPWESGAMWRKFSFVGDAQ
jgi:uncharacterized caspase-like protein